MAVWPSRHQRKSSRLDWMQMGSQVRSRSSSLTRLPGNLTSASSMVALPPIAGASFEHERGSRRASSGVFRVRASHPTLTPSMAQIADRDVVVDLRGFPAPAAFKVGGRQGNVVTKSSTNSVHRGWRLVAVDGKRCMPNDVGAALASAQKRGRYSVTFRIGEAEDDDDLDHMAAAAAAARQAAIARVAAAAQEEAERARRQEEERRRLAEMEAERKRIADQERQAAEQRRMEEEEEKRRLAEEARLQAELEAENKRREEEEERRRKEAEQLEQERKRQELEEAERRRKEEEAARLRREAEEAERKRQEAEERLRKEAEEVERKRREAEEVERKRREAEEAEHKRRLAEEAEQRRRAEEEARRRQQEAEDAERKRREAEEVERKRREAEEAALKREAEEADRKRRKEEAEARRREAEESLRKHKEAMELERKRREAEEAMRKQREAEEAERRQREAEEAKRKQREASEAERARREAEEIARKRREEAEREQRLAEANRLRQEQEELARLQAENAVVRRAAEKKLQQATGLPPREKVAEPQKAMLSAMMAQPPKPPAKPNGPCDKCDGKHDTDACPHFKKGRDKHADAWQNYGSKGAESASSQWPILRRARVVAQPGDGSCLFHSLSYGLRGTNASRLRAEIAEYIARNPNTTVANNPIKDWVLWDTGLDTSSYASRMRTGSQWGGAVELAVCAKMRSVQVHVYERGAGGFKRISSFEGDAGAAAPVVSLLYGGRVHYDALEV